MSVYTRTESVNRGMVVTSASATPIDPPMDVPAGGSFVMLVNTERVVAVAAYDANGGRAVAAYDANGGRIGARDLR